MFQNCERILVRDDIEYSRCDGTTETEAFILRAIQLSQRQGAGYAVAEKMGRRGLKMGLVKVRDDLRQKKIGTKLYELAAQEACSRRQVLGSDDLRSRYAEAFWRKQAAKGRAVCSSNRPGSVFHPKEGADDPRLPQPTTDATGRMYWPCGRYSLSCPATSLEGTRRRRRR